MSDFETPLGTMRFTLRASKEINAFFGNFLGATQRVASFDSAAYNVVAAAGLGKKVSEVEEAVFAAGMQSLQEPFTEYLERLANGGKPWTRKDEDAPKGEG